MSHRSAGEGLESNNSRNALCVLFGARLNRLQIVRRLAAVMAVLMFWSACGYAATPQRIVSLAPNLTEILYGLGAFDRVVGVSEYSSYPAQVAKLPKVGGWTTPDLERIVALRPDLVVMTEAQDTIFGYHLRQLGIRVLVSPSLTVNDVFVAIKSVGDAVGKPREAANLIAGTRAALDRVRSRTAGLHRPSVLLVVDRAPGSLRDLYAAAQGSYLGEIIEIAGGRVIVPPTKAGYSSLSKETLVALNPDIIIELRTGAQAKELERARSDWSVLPGLNAVRNGKVIELPEEFIPHNSQLIAQTVQLMARILHPEIPPQELTLK